MATKQQSPTTQAPSDIFIAVDLRLLAVKKAMERQKQSRWKVAPFVYKPFSTKQKQILTWWMDDSPVKDKEGIIADGAIRSGKTLSMSLSFGLWAMARFDNQKFLMCGKTIGSLRRNVVFDWVRQMRAHGYKIVNHRGDNLLVVTKGGRTNYFHLFGGQNEKSQDLVQGITAAGAFFDEVALMPRSFVDQAVGRCSVDGSKFWFNCNPDSPRHWFKVEWIDRLLCNQKAGPEEDGLEEKPVYKDLIHLHFSMDDNLSLSEKIKNRYRSMFSGVFYRRFIKGEWCAADGLIYDMFDPDIHTYKDTGRTITGRRYIFVDYGTTNPTAFLDVYDDGKTLWVVNEYYYDSKKHNRQKTNREYADDFVKFVGTGPDPVYVVMDPSAASFKLEIRTRGYRVKEADNDVVPGIEKVATMFTMKALQINERCINLINELLGYIWDEKAAERGEEKPVKQNDHACDALRYGVFTLINVVRRFAA